MMSTASTTANTIIAGNAIMIINESSAPTINPSVNASNIPKKPKTRFRQKSLFSLQRVCAAATLSASAAAAASAAALQFVQVVFVV